MPDKNKQSLQKMHPKRIDIIVLLLVSAVFLAIGLVLPVLSVRQLWEKNIFSILSGISNLWKEHYYFLATIIFFFSIIFPIFKLGALFVIWFVRLSDSYRKRLLRVLEFLGKWSMLDVFVVAVIVVAIKMGVLASAKAEIGIFFFSASILSSMITTSLMNATMPKKN